MNATSKDGEKTPSVEGDKGKQSCIEITGRIGGKEVVLSFCTGCSEHPERRLKDASSSLLPPGCYDRHFGLTH
jgi:hypothetical protein